MRAAIFLLLAGCFGEGPAPSQPARATLLFALDLHPIQQDNCQPGPFIGNVAIGDDAGYVVTHAFLPSCSGSGGDNGGNQRPIPSAVFEFDKRGGPSTKIGDAGMTISGGGSPPRIAAAGSDAVWMFVDATTSIVNVRSKSGQIAGTFAPTLNQGIPTPVSFIVDSSLTYVAVGPPANESNFNSPRYPSGGPINMNNNFNFVQVANGPSITSAMELGNPPSFFYEQMKESLVENTSSLFFVEHAAPIARVTTQPKGGGAREMLATLQAQPAGLAADDTHVAWSTTTDFKTTDTRSCTISATTVAAPRTETSLLSTNAFSCFDLALDGDHIYFTMVERFDGNYGPLTRNLGIGRIKISTKEVESVALGISGPHGPRQLFVDGDGIIVVTPFAVARIAKAELDGLLDIKP